MSKMKQREWRIENVLDSIRTSYTNWASSVTHRSANENSLISLPLIVRSQGPRMNRIDFQDKGRPHDRRRDQGNQNG